MFNSVLVVDTVATLVTVVELVTVGALELIVRVALAPPTRVPKSAVTVAVKSGAAASRH